VPPSRKRRERPIEGPLPKSVHVIRANLGMRVILPSAYREMPGRRSHAD
jgi:hypothetical protein